MRLKHSLHVFALGVSLLSLGGCEAFVLGGGYAATRALTQEQLNFRAKNYATADYLYQQADAFIDPRVDLVLAEPLTDIDQPGMSSTVSKIIPEQVGVRLSQLGYRMDLSKVATTPDTNYLKPAIATGEAPDFILTGTYKRHRAEMDVSLRMVDIKRNRIIATFDYVLALRGDMGEMAKPEPKIMRVTSP